MHALAVQNIPEGKEWLYEVKFDGYRCLAGRDKSAATLWSRRANFFTSQFPHIARACEQLPAETLLDGDNPFDSIIVGYYQGGKLLYAAKVRNGFVSNTRREVAAKLKGLEIDACPFANPPERKRTRWALTRDQIKTVYG